MRFELWYILPVQSAIVLVQSYDSDVPHPVIYEMKRRFRVIWILNRDSDDGCDEYYDYYYYYSRCSCANCVSCFRSHLDESCMKWLEFDAWSSWMLLLLMMRVVVVSVMMMTTMTDECY